MDMLAFAYSRPPPPPKMPSGLRELMEDLTREVLKQGPTDVHEFCANHMKKLLEIRDGPPKMRKLTLEEKISNAQKVVKARAEKRMKKFDTSIGKSDDSLDKDQSLETVKVPVHTEKYLKEGLELEIFPEDDKIFEPPNIIKHVEPLAEIIKEFGLNNSKDEATKLSDKDHSVSDMNTAIIKEFESMETLETHDSATDKRSSQTNNSDTEVNTLETENNSKIENDEEQVLEQVDMEKELKIDDSESDNSHFATEILIDESEIKDYKDDNLPTYHEIDKNCVNDINNDSNTMIIEGNENKKLGLLQHEEINDSENNISNPSGDDVLELEVGIDSLENEEEGANQEIEVIKYDGPKSVEIIIEKIKDNSLENEKENAIELLQEMTLEKKLEHEKENQGIEDIKRDEPESVEIIDKLSEDKSLEDKKVEANKEIEDMKHDELEAAELEKENSLNNEKDANHEIKDIKYEKLASTELLEEMNRGNMSEENSLNNEKEDNRGIDDIKRDEPKSAKILDKIIKDNSLDNEKADANKEIDDVKHDEPESAELREKINPDNSLEDKKEESNKKIDVVKHDEPESAKFMEIINQDNSSEDEKGEANQQNEDIEHDMPDTVKTRDVVEENTTSINENKNSNETKEEVAIQKMTTIDNDVLKNFSVEETELKLQAKESLIDSQNKEADPITTASDEIKSYSLEHQGGHENESVLKQINDKILEANNHETDTTRETAKVDASDDGEKESKMDVDKMQQAISSEGIHYELYSSNDNTLQENSSGDESHNIGNSTMDLETAAVTIQKVFRSFLFKSRNSTFDDAASDESTSVDKDAIKEEASEYIGHNEIKNERRTLGISRMDSVLQTVNEEKSLSLSTDDSSTLSSAATTIQAHVRGFLVRNKLGSNKTASTNSQGNSNKSESTDLPEQTKNKTVLNIHIVPENGHFVSRDDSILASMDLSMDGSPPTSTNLHPLSYDISEKRKQLKREDAIQSVSPPSNNSGKLSEDTDSVKEVVLSDPEIMRQQSTVDTPVNINEDPKQTIDSRETTPSQSITEDTVKTAIEVKKPESISETKGTLVKHLDEMDLVTPFQNDPTSDKAESKLLHSGEFHDAVLPTKVSRNDSVIREFKNVLAYFLIWK